MPPVPAAPGSAASAPAGQASAWAPRERGPAAPDRAAPDPAGRDGVRPDRVEALPAEGQPAGGGPPAPPSRPRLLAGRAWVFREEVTRPAREDLVAPPQARLSAPGTWARVPEEGSFRVGPTACAP